MSGNLNQPSHLHQDDSFCEPARKQRRQGRTITIGGVWPNCVTFFNRDLEEKVRTEIEDLCKQRSGALIVWGECGIGKTTLVNHVLRDDTFLENACGDTEFFLWLNICQLTMAEQFDETSFYSALIEVLSAVRLADASTKPTFAAVQCLLNEKRPKLLIVFDDVFTPDVLRCTSLFSRNCAVRCVAITRNKRNSLESADFNCKLLEVEKMATESLQVMLGEHYNLNNKLQPEQIALLAKMCLGLPLIASVIWSQFRLTVFRSGVQKCYDSIVGNFQKIAATQMTAQMTVSAFLLQCPECEWKQFRDDYYTFLVFPPGDAVEAEDLAVLWKCDPDEVVQRCQKAVDACFLRPCNERATAFDKLEDIPTSYIVHDLLHKATAERALNEYNASSLHELRKIILTRCCLLRGRNSLLLAIAYKRKAALQLFSKYVDEQRLAQMAMELDDESGTTPLHQLLSVSTDETSSWLVNVGQPAESLMSMEIFCRLADIAAARDFAGTLNMFRSKRDNRHGKTVLDYITATLKIGCKWYENAFLAAAKFGCSNVVKAVLQEEGINEGAAVGIDNDGNNALHLAVDSGHAEVVRVLIASGLFDVNRQNKLGETALMKCAKQDDCVNIAKLLFANISNPANADIIEATSGETAVIIAVRFGQEDLVRYLVTEQNASITFANKDYLTALDMALVVSWHPEIGRFLIGKGARMTAEMFRCAVQNAASRGRHDVLEYLQSNKKSVTGNSQVLSLKSQQDIAKLLSALNDRKIDVNSRDEVGDTALILACQQGHIDAVRLLIDLGANVDIQNRTGLTALMVSCDKSHFELATLLVKKGANVNLQSLTGQTALMFASEKGHFKVAKLLLDMGASVDVQNQAGWSALMLACQNENFELAALLVEYGERVDAQTHTGATALMFACEKGYFDVAKSIVHKGVNIDVQDKSGKNALMFACQAGHFEVAKLLVDRGVNIDVQDETGWSSLMLACQGGYLELAKLLLNNGAKVHVQDRTGMTALMVACQNGHIEIAKLLADGGAVLDAQDQQGSTAAMFACLDGHFEVAKLLLEKGATVDVQNHKMVTTLMLACKNGHFQIAKLLIDAGASVDAEDEGDVTALMYSCAEGHFEIAKLLLDRGASIDRVDASGWTVLTRAADKAHERIVQLLVDRNAKVNEALMMAASCGHRKAVETLIDGPINVDAVDKYGYSALMKAAMNGHDATVRLLVDRSGNLNLVNNVGWTALMLAASNGQVNVVKMLIGENANTGACDQDGFTALTLASSQGHAEIAQLLQQPTGNHSA